jgi:LysR family hydrogen peroxide-inducible transcriptional activator
MIDITLTQLEYIIAVDTYRHFVKAADACFVTQPTLSMQIKKLEDTLGEVVFDRSKQPIVPTDIGKKIIIQARIVIAERNKIEEVVKDNAADISGELSIGIIPSLAPYLLPLFNLICYLFLWEHFQNYILW